ncbi:MAG: hypothetical protein NT013_24205 [Planctomycetia bacterium]|nr:hypothetical protein [Planctomycetia bacterium]
MEGLSKIARQMISGHKNSKNPVAKLGEIAIGLAVQCPQTNSESFPREAAHETSLVVRTKFSCWSQSLFSENVVRDASVFDTIGIHSDRAFGGHRDYCGVGVTIVASSAKRARGGTANSMQKPSQANEHFASQFP